MFFNAPVPLNVLRRHPAGRVDEPGNHQYAAAHLKPQSHCQLLSARAISAVTGHRLI